MRGRTKEIHKELQDQDPIGSPHLEEKVIGRNIDLDLLSLFPQRYARIMGGIERGASFPRAIMVGEIEKEGKTSYQTLGKKGGLLQPPPPRNMTVTAI
jgi:hypothetical protein